VVNEDSVARFEAAVVDARRDGDVAVGGGRPDLPGLFVEPTVVTGLPRGHRLERDELFLPFVTVSTVGSLDEAIAEALLPAPVHARAEPDRRQLSSAASSANTAR
jgi:1-pyrroline-5-carboxylate dehydrogenase